MSTRQKPVVAALLTAPRVTTAMVENLHRQLKSDPTAKAMVVVGVEGTVDLPPMENTYFKSLSPAVKPKSGPLRDIFRACVAWSELAIFALRECGADFVVFLGPDVKFIQGSRWFEHLMNNFEDIAKSANVPFGVGCVVLRERNAPGWPSFPVLSKQHLRVIDSFAPEEFVNQDFDPFVWRLYSDFGLCRTTHTTCVINVGGGVAGGLAKVTEPSYKRTPVEWRTEILKRHSSTVKNLWSHLHCKSSLTVATPVFRLSPADANETISKLENILRLKRPHETTVVFTMIIDNPRALDNNPVARQQLLRLEQDNCDLRIRVNSSNLGASASRNRALNECHTQWILFLDDDVDVETAGRDLLLRYEERIRSEGDHASGFVGLARLNHTQQLGASAVHFAQTSYFWHIAENLGPKDRVPWGVTANLCLRWTEKDRFDADFPKTGGGEDIDMCIKTRNRVRLPLLPAPRAAVTHPWWEKAKILPQIKRHFKWALGDALLLDKHRQYTFLSWPNALEVLVLSSALAVSWSIMQWAVWAVSVLFVDVAVHVAYTYWHRHDQFADQFARVNNPFLAIILAHVVRRASDSGRLYKHLKHVRYWPLFCHRFDWHTGLNEESVSVQRIRDFAHFVGYVLIFAILCLSQ